MAVIRRWIVLISTSFVSAGIVPPLAMAQSDTGAPTREEIERVPPPALPSASDQKLTTEGAIERAPCPLAGDQYKDIRFTLSSVDFGDTKGVSTDMLGPAYRRLIGQSLSVAAVCDIRDEAATILRRAGYLAAVQVPPQKIENGAIRFDILFAKIVDFQVRGNAGKAEPLIAGYLAAIKEQPVFNVLAAERYLLLARDIPGYDVRMTLRPAGGAPGDVIGEVQVLYNPVDLEVNIQNYGSRDVGRVAGLAQLRLNGLLGVGDRTSIGFYATSTFREQHVLQLGQEFKIGREGLTVSGEFVYAWTRPTLGGRLNLGSRTLAASLEARYPLVRRQSTNLFATAGFDFIEQRTRFAGIPLNTDKLRVVFGKLAYDSIDPNSIGSPAGYSASEPLWRIGGTLELRQGLDVFGASKGCGPALTRCNPPVVPPSRVEGDPTAFVARATAYFEYRPTPMVAFSIAPRAQYAPHALLSYEEFSAGNFSVGRGYDPGTLIGDSGVGVATEVRLGSLVPSTAKSVAVQPFAFLDAAWVWNRDAEFKAINPQRLYSAGGGLRMVYGDRVNFEVTGAVPLRTAGRALSRQDRRLLATLTIKLLPNNRR